MMEEGRAVLCALRRLDGQRETLDLVDPADVELLGRHGSLPVDDVRALVARHGFALVLADRPLQPLPMREQPVLAGA
ncbi:MAG: hypothetical protein QOJ63_1662 [Solirubrobacteraceae bacterium]|jgi:hypothetical protein|nr:hypothetical protein [Solirubrobacteraceae bacterium]